MPRMDFTSLRPTTLLRIDGAEGPIYAVVPDLDFSGGRSYRNVGTDQEPVWEFFGFAQRASTEETQRK